jgi:hypothetical protein
LDGNIVEYIRHWDIIFSVLHFSSARPGHIAGRGERLFYYQSHKERCREGDNLLQRR